MKAADNNKLRAVTFTALLVAVAVIVNMFRFTIPIGGVPALRITFSGVFLQFAAIVFGPAAGGIANGLSDVISHFIKPEGAYLPPLTVTAVLRGASVGLMWRLTKNAGFKSAGALFLAFFIMFGLWGAVNTLAIAASAGGPYLAFLRQIGAQNEWVNTNRIFSSTGRIIVTAGPVVVSAVVIAAYGIARLARRKKTDAGNAPVNYLRFCIATGIPCLLFTTVNTQILRVYFLLPERAFVFLWIPRFVEEIILVLINAYVLTVLMNIYNKTMKPAA